MLYANNHVVTYQYRKVRRIPTAILVQDKYKKKSKKDIK